MDTPDDPTRTSERATAPASTPASTSSRFTPGTILDGRYRVVSLLGRGGMGEVYRADDLKLDQPVALKFLPEGLVTDPVRLSRFLTEVRLARQVTHPNVCRVHDVGEVDGQTFLSMEYVDGEDLHGLLRRAGRLSLERGIELSRQICLGLAAAHERGILHRDLKPANVMVDGRGRARLSDFGLAVAEGGGKGEIAGTPAYMAPEQLAGAPLDARTDVYALGLVLYEIFTGRAPFAARTVSEMVRMQREEVPPAPSMHVPELDRDLEALILKCLEKDPARRPSSAIAVAAALPGGDALGALVAAGETPPPELVAAAGARGAAISPAAAWAAFAFVVVGLPLGFFGLEKLTILHGVPLDKPPEVLVEQARQAARLARPEPGTAEAWGLEADPSEPADRRLRLWYRQAPARFEAVSGIGRVSLEDPPLGAGMVRVRVDSQGRLLELVAVPEVVQGGEPDWTTLLRLTGAEPGTFRPAPPSRLPPVYADRRVAWRDVSGNTVEAAAAGGRPVYFSALPAEPRARDRGARGSFAVLWAVALVGGLLLAVRNLRAGRGDRRGALRIFAWASVGRFVMWILYASHSTALVDEQRIVIQAAARALYTGGQLWLLYLAVEPAIRRRWPTCLVSWTRLLQGRWRDPLVGRDALVGITAAVVMAVVWVPLRLLSPGKSIPVDLDLLLGPRFVLAGLLSNVTNSVGVTLIMLAIALVARVVFRDLRIALVAVAALFTLAAIASIGRTGALDIPAGAFVTGVLVLLVVRFGLLALLVTVSFMGSPGNGVPGTLALGAWYAQASIVWLLLGYALAGFGLYVGTGGRPLPQSWLADE